MRQTVVITRAWLGGWLPVISAARVVSGPAGGGGRRWRTCAGFARAPRAPHTTRLPASNPRTSGRSLPPFVLGLVLPLAANPGPGGLARGVSPGGAGRGFSERAGGHTPGIACANGGRCRHAQGFDRYSVSGPARFEWRDANSMCFAIGWPIPGAERGSLPV